MELSDLATILKEDFSKQGYSTANLSIAYNNQLIIRGLFKKENEYYIDYEDNNVKLYSDKYVQNKTHLKSFKETDDEFIQLYITEYKKLKQLLSENYD